MSTESNHATNFRKKNIQEREFHRWSIAFIFSAVWEKNLKITECAILPRAQYEVYSRHRHTRRRSGYKRRACRGPSPPPPPGTPPAGCPRSGRSYAYFHPHTGNKKCGKWFPTLKSTTTFENVCRPIFRGLQRDVVYLGWSIATSYMSANAGGGEELRSLSEWVQLYSVHRSPNKLRRSKSIFNLCPYFMSFSRRRCHPV